jgi:hypothetical protein
MLSTVEKHTKSTSSLCIILLAGTNISTIPITILTTILYTSKKKKFLNHNTGTIMVYNTGTNFYTTYCAQY